MERPKTVEEPTANTWGTGAALLRLVIKPQEAREYGWQPADSFVKRAGYTHTNMATDCCNRERERMK